MSGRNWKKFHLVAAIAWMFPGVLLAYVIVYLIPDMKAAAFAILVVSLYANFATHLSAWQAARAEVVATEIQEVEEAKP